MLGRNVSGAVGDGTGEVRTEPTDSDVLSGVQTVAAGGNVSCALMTTGGVRCWGRTLHGELGDTMPLRRLTPTMVVGICER
jgi:alpha-tubulin suppressor-like RCC1 family protein